MSALYARHCANKHFTYIFSFFSILTITLGDLWRLISRLISLALFKDKKLKLSAICSIGKIWNSKLGLSGAKICPLNNLLC